LFGQDTSFLFNREGLAICAAKVSQQFFIEPWLEWLLSNNLSSYWRPDSPPRSFDMGTAQHQSRWLDWTDSVDDHAAAP
jgi:hypothetical protein